MSELARYAVPARPSAWSTGWMTLELTERPGQTACSSHQATDESPPAQRARGKIKGQADTWLSGFGCCLRRCGDLQTLL